MRYLITKKKYLPAYIIQNNSILEPAYLKKIKMKKIKIKIKLIKHFFSDQTSEGSGIQNSGVGFWSKAIHQNLVENEEKPTWFNLPYKKPIISSSIV